MSDHETGWDGPAAHRAARDRQGGQCALCWRPAPVMEAHHRLRVALMPADARWCPCNIVALCPRCHTQGIRTRWEEPMPLGSWAVHDHPTQAGWLGLVLHDGADPREEPVMVRWPWVGLGYLDHNGDLVSPLV